MSIMEKIMLDMDQNPPSYYVQYTESCSGIIAAAGCCGGSSGGCAPAKKGPDLREEVRKAYKEVVDSTEKGESCGVGTNCCSVPVVMNTDYIMKLGYAKEEIEKMPPGANMGLGCGNPRSISALKQGEIVLDLGSGGGFDAFIASTKVGPMGKVYGVDMTPEMIAKARRLAKEHNFTNVEFLLGEIEHVPLASSTVDVVISNCVVNLSTDKKQTFQEAYRVLKEGGRIAISDIVASAVLPTEQKNNVQLYCGCVSGAVSVEELGQILHEVGFKNISFEIKEESRAFLKDWYPGTGIENYVVSAYIRAEK